MIAAGVAALAAGVAALAVGCGSPAADLFVVTRAGAGPGAALTLLASDGGDAVCNGRRVRMTDPELVTARGLQRDLESPASRGVVLAPGSGAVLTYTVRTPGGTLRFSDTSPGREPVMLRVAAFTRELARGPCGLAR